MGMQDIAFKSGEAAIDLWYDGPIVRDNSMMGWCTRNSRNKKWCYWTMCPEDLVSTQCNGLLSLFKDSLRIDNFNCRYGDNRFDVALYGSNIRRNLVAGDASQPTVMDCFIRSNFINMNDFTSLFGKTSQRTASKKAKWQFWRKQPAALTQCLTNSNINVHVKATAFKKGNLHANNLDALVRFAPQEWVLQKISMNLAGGTVACSGKVQHAAGNNHLAFFKNKCRQCRYRQVTFAFDNIGQEAITSQELSGRFSTVASLQAGSMQVDISFLRA